MAIPKELMEEWGLTAEEAAVLEPVLGKPERAEKLKGSVLRQADYTRKTQELAEQRKALEASIAEKERIVAEDAASLGTWKQQADKTILENQRALEAEKTKAYALEQRMNAVATQYGVDPKEWGLDGEQKPPETKPDPSKLDERYLARTEAEKIAAELRTAPYIAAEIEDIVDEHRSIFGSGLNRRELVAAAIKNKKSLRDEWAEQYKVADKRKELQEKEIENRIKARVDEERTKILSEHKLPVTRGAEHGSPILAMRSDLKLEGKERGASNESGAVDAAVSAYNTGKYRGAVPPAEKTA